MLIMKYLMEEKLFHGMIDIEFNKIIFNTNEEIIAFKPYTNNSMLAITSKSAYKICAIKGSDNDCIDECLKGSVKYDFSKPNQCEEKEDEKEKEKEKEDEKKEEKEKEKEKEKEVEKEGKGKGEGEGNQKEENGNIILIVVIIIIIILIIAILFLFYRRWKKRNSDNALLSQIYSEIGDQAKLRN